MSDLAVITGGGRGIGLATARAFHARGVRVALFGRTRSELEAAAAEMPGAIAVECDVSSAQAVDAAARKVGDARYVINNAGVVARASVESMREDEWDRVLDVNLKGAFLVSRAFLPAMRAAGRGRIVHVASISATLGTPKLSAYCASKWGLLGFMKSLAEELRGSGVQTSAVLPGSVDTAMLVGSGFAPQMSPEHVASVIAWLALDAPEATHGTAVEVFGP